MSKGWQLLWEYTIEAFMSLIIFGVFVATSKVSGLIADFAGELGGLIRIVAWIISGCGAICCIALVIGNTITFMKYLIKGPPRGTSGGRGRLTKGEPNEAN